MKFISPTKGRMELEEVIADIKEYIKVPNQQGYTLVVGTDSQKHGRDFYTFVTTILIHRVGKGGRYYYHEVHIKGTKALGEKIHEEVADSLQVAKIIEEAGLIDLVNRFQVHIDVGKNGETEKYIKSVTGMVVGSGYEAYIKPYSYGASTVADRLTK